MIEYNVILRGRGGGKTWTIMHEMHDLILAGRATDILVVFPDTNYLIWWRRMWSELFPQVPMPRYISIQRCERVRGLQVVKIYVEDIDGYEDGIYDQRFEYIWPCLRSPLGDEEVIFTSGWLVLNQRSHSKTIHRTAKQVAQEWLREKRRRKQLEDEIMLDQMTRYIENSNAT